MFNLFNLLFVLMFPLHLVFPVAGCQLRMFVGGAMRVEYSNI